MGAAPPGRLLALTLLAPAAPAFSSPGPGTIARITCRRAPPASARTSTRCTASVAHSPSLAWLELGRLSLLRGGSRCRWAVEEIRRSTQPRSWVRAGFKRVLDGLEARSRRVRGGFEAGSLRGGLEARWRRVGGGLEAGSRRVGGAPLTGAWASRCRAAPSRAWPSPPAHSAPQTRWLPV